MQSSQIQSQVEKKQPLKAYQGQFFKNNRQGFGKMIWNRGFRGGKNSGRACVYLGNWMLGKQHGIGMQQMQPDPNALNQS